MHTQTSATRFHLQKMGSYLFNIGLLAGLSTLTFGLVSCGGGGGSSTAANTVSNAPSINSITAIAAASGATGIIAASSSQVLTIWGTNFVSGVTVTITDSASNAYTVNGTAVPKSTKITTNVTIPNVPTDSYVTVKIQPPSGSAISGILGVAHAYKTLANDIQPIFNNNTCSQCHDGNASLVNGMDLRTLTASANTLINTKNSLCTPTAQFRVTPGDPRRTSNALIDVLRAKNSLTTVNCQMPSGSASAVPASDIDAIVDWIALGAN